MEVRRAERVQADAGFRAREESKTALEAAQKAVAEAAESLKLSKAEAVSAVRLLADPPALVSGLRGTRF